MLSARIVEHLQVEETGVGPAEIYASACVRPEPRRRCSMMRGRSLRCVVFRLGSAAGVYAGGIGLYFPTGVGVLLVAAGMLLLPLALLVVRRRVWTPLARLEEGLQRVSEGDLTAEVPVLSGDELGRVATHFNQMTRVLRDRAEEQGRFAAAGELLAGVAHEVNNPLMAIATHAELRLADSDLSGDARIEMQSILRQARRASKLLRGLLRFVRAGEKRAAHVNLNEVIRSAIDLVSYRFTVDEISIEGRLDPNLPAVHGDPNRLEQVLVNLLSNALDALRSVKPPRRWLRASPRWARRSPGSACCWWTTKR